MYVLYNTGSVDVNIEAVSAHNSRRRIVVVKATATNNQCTYVCV